MILNGYLLIAAFLAALVPLSLIATRQELRRVRLRLVEELRRTLFKHEPDLPQLELVAARYRATADDTGRTRQGLIMIWTGAAFFFAVSFVGFVLMLVPRDWLLSRVPDFPMITYSLLWAIRSVPPAPLEPLDDLALAVSVAGLAFLGGYVFQLRYLVRATINLELSALAFVRATLQILQGMIVALVAFRVIYAAGIPSGETGAAAAGATTALGAAFVFGLFPNLGLMKIAKFVRVRAKTVDEDAMAAAKIVPLEVIDGIDAETAFRLEESNLFDVQNLAAINPVALYAESPFSLHEILDWVLQAQLCTNVGARAFGLLKQHKIRTIFDLERAVLARDAPPAYVRAIGAVFFDGASPAFRQAIGLPAVSAEPQDAGEIDPETVRHAVAIIVDDLHIHRLRALWRTMLRSTAGEEDKSPWLFETGPLPGDPGYPGSAYAAPRRAYAGLAPRAEPELVPDEPGPLPPPEPELAACKPGPVPPGEPELAADPPPER